MEIYPNNILELQQRLQVGLASVFNISIHSPGIFSITNEHLTILFINARHQITLDFVPTKETQIIYLDEDVWQLKKELVLFRLFALLGQAKRRYARCTVALRIDKNTACNFLEKHHIQSPITGKYRYGLFEKGQLLSVAIFSGGRRMRNQNEDYRSFELLRFCHQRDLLVVGGLSKLMSAFIQDFAPGDIMTYIDKDWSDGKGFRRVGFNKEKEIPPQSFWVDDNGQRYTQNELKQNTIVPTYQLFNQGSIKMVYQLKQRNSG